MAKPATWEKDSPEPGGNEDDEDDEEYDSENGGQLSSTHENLFEGVPIMRVG